MLEAPTVRRAPTFIDVEQAVGRDRALHPADRLRYIVELLRAFAKTDHAFAAEEVHPDRKAAHGSRLDRYEMRIRVDLEIAALAQCRHEIEQGIACRSRQTAVTRRVTANGHTCLTQHRTHDAITCNAAHFVALGASPSCARQPANLWPTCPQLTHMLWTCVHAEDCKAGEQDLHLWKRRPGNALAVYARDPVAET